MQLCFRLLLNLTHADEDCCSGCWWSWGKCWLIFLKLQLCHWFPAALGRHFSQGLCLTWELLLWFLLFECFGVLWFCTEKNSQIRLFALLFLGTQTLWNLWWWGVVPKWHPSDPCGLHVPLILVASWTKTLHLGDAMGVLLQLNTPFRYYSTDSLGFIREGLMRLRVVMASGSNPHHR